MFSTDVSHIFELVARSIFTMVKYVKYIPIELIRRTSDFIAMY